MGEEEDTGLAHSQGRAIGLCHTETGEQAARLGAVGDLGKLEETAQLLAVEVPREPEVLMDRLIEMLKPGGQDDLNDLVTGELLRIGTVAQKEAISAAVRFVGSLRDMNLEDALGMAPETNGHERVTVPGDVMDPASQRVRILDADDLAAVVHAEEDGPPGGVRESNKLPIEPRGTLLELGSLSFAQFEDQAEIRIRWLHHDTMDVGNGSPWREILRRIFDAFAPHIRRIRLGG